MEFLIVLVVGGILWGLLWLGWIFLKAGFEVIFTERKWAFVVRGDDSMLGGWEYEKYFEDEKAARSVYRKLQMKYEYTQMKPVWYHGKFDPDKTVFLEDYSRGN